MYVKEFAEVLKNDPTYVVKDIVLYIFKNFGENDTFFRCWPLKELICFFIYRPCLKTKCLIIEEGNVSEDFLMTIVVGKRFILPLQKYKSSLDNHL